MDKGSHDEDGKIICILGVLPLETEPTGFVHRLGVDTEGREQL